MSKSTIIQLAQQESDNVTQNGVYEITLDTPQMVSDGDIVQVKSAYLDTVTAGTGYIHLEEQVDCTLICAQYIQNYALDQQYDDIVGLRPTFDLRQYKNVIEPPENAGDNNLWWLASAAPIVAGTTYWNISGFNVYPTNTTSSTKRFGNVNITFEYTPLTPGATPETISIHIPSKFCVRWARQNPYSLNIQTTGTAEAPTFRLLTGDDYLASHGIKSIEFAPFASPVVASAATNMQLQTFPFNFSIPAGDYTPNELVARMNDELSVIDKERYVDETYEAASAATPITKTNWPVESPFLTTILKNTRDLEVLSAAEATVVSQVFINAESGQIDTAGNELAGTYYMEYNIVSMKAEFSAGAGSPKTGYRPPVDRYCGANEISFAYDDAEQRMKIAQMHFPIYVNDSSTYTDGVPTTIINDAVPGAEYNNVDAVPDRWIKKRGLATRYSGIAFTSMQPESFWVNQMGFTNCCILPQYTAKLKYPASDSAEPIVSNSFVIDCNEGINITGAYAGLDLGVQHQSMFFNRPVFADFNNIVFNVDANTKISTDDTTSIFSDRIFNNSLADEGFFLVDVKTNFKQQMVSKNKTTRNTQSIVNRFYNANSFTSDQGAGSIVYTHRGEPEMLSSLTVSVLNPDRSFVDTHVIGNKNTVFLEILSNPIELVAPSRGGDEKKEAVKE